MREDAINNKHDYKLIAMYNYHAQHASFDPRRARIQDSPKAMISPLGTFDVDFT